MENTSIEKNIKEISSDEKISRIQYFFKTQLHGICMVAIIAFISRLIGLEYPIIGGSVAAIVLGILIKNFFGVSLIFEKGIDFTLKILLKLAIILLGFSFNILQILEIGVSSFVIILVSVFSGLLLTYWIGKAFGLHGNTSLLIGAGTAICGATAIVTIAPILKAKEDELTYAINTIFAFNVIAILFYPMIGKLLEMPDYLFGIWAGAAIHDTSSVVAASYLFSDAAGATAIVVKLARTLMLIPLALILAILISLKTKARTKLKAKGNRVEIYKIFPYFILFFACAAAVNTIFSIPMIFTSISTNIAKFLIIMVMVSVGLKTDIKTIRKVGHQPLFVGLIASLLIGLISIGLIYMLV